MRTKLCCAQITLYYHTALVRTEFYSPCLRLAARGGCLRLPTWAAHAALRCSFLAFATRPCLYATSPGSSFVIRFQTAGIKLNIEGYSIVSAPVHAPSRAPLLLRPRLVVCCSTCPPVSPSPHANSFVISTALINTHSKGPSDLMYKQTQLEVPSIQSLQLLSSDSF